MPTEEQKPTRKRGDTARFLGANMPQPASAPDTDDTRTVLADDPAATVEISTDCEAEVQTLRRSTDALYRSEKLYRDLVESANVVIVAADRGGRLVYVSPFIRSLLGIGPEEMIGRHFSRFVHPDDVQALDEAIAGAKPGETLTHEVRVLAASGRTRCVRASGSAIVEGGRVEGARALLVDVTEQKTFERRFLEAVEAEQRRIGRDLHDGLNQELAAAAYMVKSMELSLDADDAERAAHAAQISELMNGLLERTRDIARLLNPVGTESAGGLDTALRELAERMSGAYKVNCTFDTDGRVRAGDVAAQHVFRIAQEAVGNAIRHGGARNVGIELSAAGTRAYLKVTDDGCGLRPGWAESGGMGMRTMRQRARMLDGVLRVQPAGDAGVSVTCVFPFEPEKGTGSDDREACR